MAAGWTAMLSALYFLQKGLLDSIPEFQTEDKNGDSKNTQKDHAPERYGNCGAANSACDQKPPGPGDESDNEKAERADGSQSGKDADDIVREEGEQKYEEQKYVLSGADKVQIFFRNLSTDNLIGEWPSENPREVKHQKRAEDHGCIGQKKRLPQPKENGSGQSSNVTRYGGKDYRQKLDQKEKALPVGGGSVNILLHCFLGGECRKKAALPKKERAAAKNHNCKNGRDPLDTFCQISPSLSCYTASVSQTEDV